MNIKIPLLLFLVATLSCQEAKETDQASRQEPRTEQANELIQSGITNEETYVVYLPKVSSNRELPVVFCFDPQANADTVISLYKELADQYKYILVASKYSKNGMNMDMLLPHFNKLHKGVAGSYPVDQNRIYLMGFSGGGKVATQIALGNPNIAGVITCGAAMKFADAANKNFTYTAIAGKADFNYPNMLFSYFVMEKMGLNYTFQTFEGKHEWPPIEEMDKAFKRLDLNAMKEGDADGDEQGFYASLRESEQDIAHLNASENPLDFYIAYQNIIYTYDGLVDVSSYEFAAQKMKEDGRLNAAFKSFQTDLETEEKLKQQYISYFKTKDLAWWKAEIKRLKADNSETSQRVLGFLGLVAYMQTNAALKVKPTLEASKLSAIYLMLEPENPEAMRLAKLLE